MWIFTSWVEKRDELAQRVTPQPDHRLPADPEQKAAAPVGSRWTHSAVSHSAKPASQTGAQRAGPPTPSTTLRGVSRVLRNARAGPPRLPTTWRPTQRGRSRDETWVSSTGHLRHRFADLTAHDREPGPPPAVVAHAHVLAAHEIQHRTKNSQTRGEAAHQDRPARPARRPDPADQRRTQGVPPMNTAM